MVKEKVVKDVIYKFWVEWIIRVNEMVGIYRRCGKACLITTLV